MNQAKQSAENNMSIANGAVLITWIAAGCGMALALLLGIYLAISITRPINRWLKAKRCGRPGRERLQPGIGASQQLAQGSSQQAVQSRRPHHHLKKCLP